MELTSTNAIDVFHGKDPNLKQVERTLIGYNKDKGVLIRVVSEKQIEGGKQYWESRYYVGENIVPTDSKMTQVFPSTVTKVVTTYN